MYIDGNGDGSKRDLFPKMDLRMGYVGDFKPLCARLPPKHFLSKGARWSYVDQPYAKLQQEWTSIYSKGNVHHAGGLNSLPRMRLNPLSSALHAVLCGAASAGGPCNFRSETYLSAHLPCDGDECDIDTVAVVDVLDPVSNTTTFFECGAYSVVPVPSSQSLPSLRARALSPSTRATTPPVMYSFVSAPGTYASHAWSSPSTKGIASRLRPILMKAR